MTGSTVLVVRVPRPIEDADACIEHIKRGLRDGILVLGADVKYTECSRTRAGGAPPRENRWPLAKHGILIEDEMAGAIAGFAGNVYD